MSLVHPLSLSQVPNVSYGKFLPFFLSVGPLFEKERVLSQLSFFILVYTHRRSAGNFTSYDKR